MSMLCRVLGILTFAVGVTALAAGQSGGSKIDPGGPPRLSCSPAPCVLPPTQVSPGPNTADSAPIASDPSNSRNLIVGSNDYNCGFHGEEGLGFFVSLDAGAAWSQVCMPSVSAKGQDYVPDLGAILGYDRNGVAYIGGGYVDNGSGSSVSFEAFQKSSDGVHWSVPAPAVYRKNYGPGDCWMSVDTNADSPYVNSVYISCVLGGPPGSFVYNQMVVSHSNDGGTTWHQVDVAPRQVDPAQDFYNSMTVGKDGTVYLTWQYCDQGNACDNGPVYMLFSKSSDGGNTWSKPAVVAAVTLIYPLPNVPDAFVANAPAIGVDNSDGPYAGSLYVAMYNWTGTFMQVQVVRSTDGGTTWSKPVPVAPGITHDQFFPWIAVSPNGLVGVMWVDRRNDPANVNYQAFAGISSDGGLNFDPNIELTTTFSDLATDNGPFGQYNGATWDGPNYFLAAWMDQSNGVNTQDYVGGIRLK
jgi:hypothetical protein